MPTRLATSAVRVLAIDALNGDIQITAVASGTQRPSDLCPTYPRVWPTGLTEVFIVSSLDGGDEQGKLRCIRSTKSGTKTRQGRRSAHPVRQIYICPTKGRVPEVVEWSERTCSNFPLHTTLPHLCALPSGGRPTSKQETRAMTPESVIAKAIIHKSLVLEDTAHLVTFGGGAQ